MDLKSLRYSESHEWTSLEGDVCTIGITQFAVDQLTDIVYIDLKDAGTRLGARDRFGEIESVKAVSDLYAPVEGTIVAVNDKVKGDTSLITGDPYGKGWLVKIKVAPGTTLDGLMTLEQYQKQIAEGGH
jgi:glycine cleavage system H protein